MSRIRVLPDLLVNKIAAGEVIERPASVVKELMENAVDAQAGHVILTIEEGGRRLIKVTDDGAGMNAEDLTLAVTPHATSKLASEDDLYSIHTLGFRGEALPSIGAVSHLTIRSRRPDDDEGAEIVVTGERIERCRPAGCPPGTTVEVRDLFFNVPARRKFLRAVSTETGHINEQFCRIAVPHNHLGFELHNGNRLTYRLPPGQSRQERIARLFGEELGEELLAVNRYERGLKIEAYIAPPARNRATTAGQYIFVNGRFIRDRVLAYAIREAYRGLMEHTRNPVVYVFLELDPAELDMNVHPTKIEVRWSDGNLVRSQVLSALRETLHQSDLAPALRAGRTENRFTDEQRDELRRQFAGEFKAALTERPALPSYAGSEGGSATPYVPPAGRSSAGYNPGADAGARALWRSYYDEPENRGIERQPVEANTAPQPNDEPGGAGAAGSGQLDPYADQRPVRAIQVHNAYLVAETPEGMVIIDQHALHERVLYEKFRQRFTAGPLESQRLLLPETVEVTPQQQALLADRADLLHELGVEFTPFGPNTIAVQAFPSLLGDVDVKAFVTDLVDRLGNSGGQTHAEVVIHELLDMMACKAAVKAGDPLTADEINALLANRHLVDKHSNCPHGRPTTLRLDLKDLERQFKRT